LEITNLLLKGDDCKSSPAAANFCAYPVEQGYDHQNRPFGLNMAVVTVENADQEKEPMSITKLKSTVNEHSTLLG